MKRPALLFTRLLFAAFLTAFTAASSEQPEDILKLLDAAEEEAFTLKSRGDYRGALARLGDSLDIVFSRSAEFDSPLRDELHARGEVYAEMIYNLDCNTSDWNEIGKRLEKAPTDAPVLKGLADFLLLRCRMHTGDLEDAARLRDRLGFITDWLVIGPFDNERGGGFNASLGPEKELDLLAEYDGKDRSISWRKNPCTPITGFIDFDALFKPRNQSLAYALCFLETNREKDIALRLGSDEAFKVFFNGREIHKLDARRLLSFDQDVIGLRLKPGKNALLLKVCDKTGNWGFAARLTEPDGSILRGVSVTTDPEGYTPDRSEDEIPAVSVSRGAFDLFRSGAAAGNARHHFYLGFLHYIREYEGEDAGRAEHHLEAFLEKSPRHVTGNAFLALARARRYEMKSEKDDNPKRLALEKTLEIDPSNAECHLRLSRYYTHSLWIPAEARRHAEAALKINPAFLQAALHLCDILYYMGLKAPYRNRVLALGRADENLDDPDLLAELGLIAENEMRFKDAERYYQSALAVDFANSKARESLMDLALERGDTERAEKLGRETWALDPYETDEILDTADLYLGEEKYDDAIVLIESALRVNPDDDGVLRILGRAHDLAGRREAALEHYERALDINPKAEKLRRHVEFLKETEKPFEDDFKIRAVELIAAHPPGRNPENSPCEHLLRQDIYKVNPDGTSSHYHHEVVRVLNDKGTETFDYFSTAYAMDEQRARIKTARVIHPDGTVEEARIDNRVHREYARGGYLPAFVNLPPLKAGDVIDVDYRIDDLKQSFFGNYFGLKHFFLGRDLQKVKDSRLTLILPKEREFAFNTRHLDVSPEESEKDGHRVLTWAVKEIPKKETEPRMPGRREFAPCVEVSTYGSWEELAHWWWRLVEKQCDVSDEMKEKVAELTAGCTTEMDRIRALYNFVVSDIRYNDTWEFGIHGFKPYRASAIFNNRFGDCKDKAILIRSLLAEAGIEAYPVMIRLERFRSKEDLSLPLVGHFNHAIAYVPAVDGGPGMFLDGTAQYHPVHALPDEDRGAAVVVVNGEGCEIMTIPYAEPDANTIRVAYSVDVENDGGARIAVHAEYTGTIEARVRRRFLNEGKRESEFKSIYGRVFGEVDIDEIGFTDVNDLDTPVRYDLIVRVRSLLLKSGDNYQIKSVFFPSELGRTVAQDKRNADLLMGAFDSIDKTISYSLPAGLEADKLPDDVEIENRYGTFRLAYTLENKRILVKRILKLNAPRVPAGDYPAFRDFCREIEKAEEKMIQIRDRRE